MIFSLSNRNSTVFFYLLFVSSLSFHLLNFLSISVKADEGGDDGGEFVTDENGAILSTRKGTTGLVYFAGVVLGSEDDTGAIFLVWWFWVCIICCVFVFSCLPFIVCFMCGYGCAGMGRRSRH